MRLFRTSNRACFHPLLPMVPALIISLLFSTVSAFALEDGVSAADLVGEPTTEVVPNILTPAAVAGDCSGATDEGAYLIGEASPYTLVLVLDHSDMQYAVAMIREGFSPRVCFEKIAYDGSKDFITLGDALALYEKTKETRPLTKKEEVRFNAARNLRDSGKLADYRFDVATKRITCSLSAPTLDALLDELTGKEAFPEYTWEKRNGTYVVFPREISTLDFPVNLTIDNEPLTLVVERVLEQQPANAGMSYFSMSRGPSTSRVDAARVGKLVLRDVPARGALCRVIEASDPDFSWELAGYKGQRKLSITYATKRQGAE